MYGVEHPRLIISWPTSSGKGKACMMVIDKAPTLQKWLVVVPELIQIENLKTDIAKHGMERIYDKIEDIICYASFRKYSGRELSIWFNECHRLSELRSDIGETVTSDRILADSATIPEVVLNRLYRLGSFFEYKIDLQEAINLELLPEPSIHVVQIDLDDKARKAYDVIEKKIAYWQDRAMSGEEMYISNMINKYGMQRKTFLAEYKTAEARRILTSLESKRTLCYTGSVDQCNKLGGHYAINSTKGKKHNLEVLRKFNSYEIDRIYMNKMGREGLNLEGIRAMVMVQLSSGRDENLEFIQKIGRSLRSTEPEVYILVCKDTIDTTYLRRALKDVDKTKIKYL